MSFENINSGSSYYQQQQQQQNENSNSNSIILQLPYELLTRIFILAQNPVLRYVSRQFYQVSKPSLIKAQFLIQQFGKSLALGETSMKSFRMAFTLPVIDSLLKLHVHL
ncbi:unnamed protein product [Cunninghamella blakesleeana]